MACIVFESGRSVGNPEDYGCPDWHHDSQGRVNYPWYKDWKDEEDEDITLPSREDQRWYEECSEAAWDNMSYERNRHAYRCEAFDEWERNERLYN